MDAKKLTDDAIMTAITGVCEFESAAAEKWRTEALLIGRAVESAVRAAIAPSDAAQAPLPTRYFVQGNDGGYEEFNTDEERDKAHRAAIEGYLDDGWSEEVESVVSGIVTHRTVQTDVELRPPRCTEHPEQDNDDCDACVAWGEFPNHDFDMCCRYEPEQIAAPVAPAAVAPFDERVAASDFEQMTPNQKRALSKGLAALETMADLWAVEVRLTEMASRIAAVPDESERAKRVAVMIHLGFVEGAYRHFLDHKDAAASPAPLAAAELTDDEIDAVWDSVPWKDLNVNSLEHVKVLRRRFARALLSTTHGDKQS